MTRKLALDFHCFFLYFVFFPLSVTCPDFSARVASRARFFFYKYACRCNANESGYRCIRRKCAARWTPRMSTDIVCRAYYSRKLGAIPTIIICHALSTFVASEAPRRTINEYNGEYNARCSLDLNFFRMYARPLLPSHSDFDDYTAFSVARRHDYTVLRRNS